MNTVGQTEASVAAGYTAPAYNDKTAQKTTGQSAQKTSRVTNGRTIGDARLSEKAQKYYDQLRKKYGNMDFILVSEDMKEQAQANAAKYANASRMVVLIDTEKIERMAEDEDYRKQYEAIISGATSQLGQIKDSLGANAGCVKGYGMQVNDNGTASFFAVIDKSLAAQRDRIEKKSAQKAEAKKQARKAAEQKQAEERRTEHAEEKRKAEKQDKVTKKPDRDNEVTVTANSVEELIQKINDTVLSYVQTDAERQVGQNFDFSI